MFSSVLAWVADGCHCVHGRSWLAVRSMLRGTGADGEALRSLEGSLLAALLLALQRVPPLLGPNGAPRSEARAALRAGLTQVRCGGCVGLGLWELGC